MSLSIHGLKDERLIEPASSVFGCVEAAAAEPRASDDEG